MYTEDEAKEKWCPEYQVCTRCIASGCMHWRWANSGEWASPNGELHGKTPEECGAVWTGKGYCGLSGKP